MLHVEPRRGRRNRWLLGPAWATVVLAIIAPQLLGGATARMELVILTAACLVSTWTAVALGRTHYASGLAPVASLGACLATLWTFLQIVPVPCAWVAAADPDRAHVLQQLTSLGVLQGPRCTLSFAPGSGRASLAVAATLAALLLTATALARAGYRKLLMLGVALSSVAMSLVAIAHTVAKVDRVFGVYAPQQAHAVWMLAPLMNPNHLAGHLALGFPLCLAFGLRAKQRADLRMLWLGLAFLVLTTGLFTLSRGGAAALTVGGGGCLLLHLAQRERGGPHVQLAPRRWILTVACATAIFALGAYFTADLLSSEFGTPDATASKLKLMLNLLPLVAQHPLVGVGRGALGDASPRVTTGNVRVVYAEDLPLQWVLEWGAPVTLIVLSLVVASFAALRLRRMDEWATALGFFALCAQNLVDFSMERAGVACVATIALATLLTRERIDIPLLRRMPRPALRRLALAASVAAVLSTAAAAPLLARGAEAGFRATLERQLDSGDQEFATVLSSALRAYPLAPSLIMLGAEHAVRANARSAPTWLNLSLELAPGWTAPHIQAAYYLERRGAISQAAGELRLGFEMDYWQTLEPAAGFLVRHPQATVALAMLPERSERRQAIAEMLVFYLLSARAPQTELEQLVTQVLHDFPHAAFVQSRYVELAMQDGNAELALQRARTMGELCPAEPKSAATLISVLVRAGRAREALAEFDRAAPRTRADREVLLGALAAAGAAADGARLAALSEELFAHFGTSAKSSADLHLAISLQYQVAGKLGDALSHAQQSYELAGDVGTLERVHQLAKAAGMTQVALRAATELCHVGHHREAYCQ